MEEIKTISIKDKDYPKALKKIQNPPETLYYRGNLPQTELCFAIVGARRCSSYGKQTAFKVAEDLTETGLIIVSGLAPGIDTFSHLAVVEKNKQTIAVLGTGVDTNSIYPKENIRLAEKILKNNGCLISEYPPGTHGSKFTFPQRNRIISGLSLGVLIVEAKQKSGALITANYAFSQKRKVFAIPGSIYSLNSKGCHYLIKKGAKLVENINDILRELNLSSRKLSSFSKGENQEENLILKVLREEALYIDKIIEKTKLPASIIAGTLAILEIKGKVKNLEGNVYALTR